MSMVMEFIRNNVVCDICLVLAILAWILTIGAMISSKRSGHFVSGIPAVGGILVIIGFLTSDVKWLAVLGLLDPHLLYLLFKVIPEFFTFEKKIKNWTPPDVFEGEKVIDHTNYNKCYDEIVTPQEPPYADELHTINRYIIVSSDDGFTLLGIESMGKVVTRSSYETIDECRRAAPSKAKWMKKEV